MHGADSGHEDGHDGPPMRAYLRFVHVTMRLRCLTLLSAFGIQAVSVVFMVQIPGAFLPQQPLGRAAPGRHPGRCGRGHEPHPPDHPRCRWRPKRVRSGRHFALAGPGRASRGRHGAPRRTRRHARAQAPRHRRGRPRGDHRRLRRRPRQGVRRRSADSCAGAPPRRRTQRPRADRRPAGALRRGQLRPSGRCGRRRNRRRTERREPPRPRAACHHRREPPPRASPLEPPGRASTRSSRMSSRRPPHAPPSRAMRSSGPS